MKYNVLLIEPTIRPIGVDILEKTCNIFIAPDGSEKTITSYIQKYNIQALCARVEQITAKIIRDCPTLNIIGQHGVGVDNIDIAEATNQGVAVVNVPDSNYVSVAEHAMMLILACARRVIRMDRYTRQGDWQSRNRVIPNEVMNKKVLIVGMGRQGQEMALKLKAFRMIPYGFDPFVVSKVMQQQGVIKVEDIHDVLHEVDFVSIHVPLTTQTKHMFASKEFNQMKESAYLINVGRGPVVDQEALVEALSKNVIAGAGLDVFDVEPIEADAPILALDNVIVSPHLAGDTIESKDRCSEYLANDIILALNKQLPNGLYNKEILEKEARFMR